MVQQQNTAGRGAANCGKCKYAAQAESGMAACESRHKAKIRLACPGIYHSRGSARKHACILYGCAASGLAQLPAILMLGNRLDPKTGLQTHEAAILRVIGALICRGHY